jgi:hypothetical protein
MVRTQILFATGDGQGGQGKARLNLVSEYEKVENAIQRSRHRDEFELCPPLYEATYNSLFQRLATDQPKIIHFGGHGIERKLILLDDDKLTTRFPAEKVVDLFCDSSLPRLVVLSACQSLEVAEKLIERVDFSIGTKQNLGDSGAISFAGSLYKFLGDGWSLKDAHEKAIKAMGHLDADQSPKLLCRQGTNAAVFRFAPQPLDPIEPFIDCSYWIGKLEKHLSQNTLSDQQVAEILIYSLQPALYLGVLGRLRKAAERLQTANSNADLENARRLVKWVSAFNEETAKRKGPAASELDNIVHNLSQGWPVLKKDASILAKWIEVQRVDWLGLAYQRIDSVKNSAMPEDFLFKAKDNFVAARKWLKRIPLDAGHPVRELWNGFIALNHARALMLLEQIPEAIKRMSEAEKFRRSARAKFSNHKIESEIAEQLQLEVCLAQLGLLELRAKEGCAGADDHEAWKDIVVPLKAKRDRWKGIWAYIFGEIMKVANARGWDSTELQALHDRADRSIL